MAAAANNEEKSTCAQCGLPKSRRAYTDNDWNRGANGERKCIACHRANLADALQKHQGANSRSGSRDSGSAASGAARGRIRDRYGLRKLSKELEENGKNIPLLLVYLPMFAAFGSALFAAYLWHGLLVVIPGYLYKYSGPIKWLFDPIRARLNSILFSGSGKSDDEDCVSLIGHLGGCVSGIGYGIVGMVLLVFYLKFTLNPRFDRVRTYNKAVASWQEGLADEYASNWTSNAAQLPTLHLEQTVEDDDQSMNLTYTPAFHLETNTTFEQSLPHLDTPGDMNKYEAKTMVAATIENFHVATTPPSEGDGVLTVRIGAQNFTFATVRRTLNCGSVLRGLIFVFDDEVRKHECTPMYDNPAGVCYDKWSSLDPPQNIALRVEIRSPTDPVIVARDLFGCPSPPSLYYSSPMWDPSERAAWRTVTILAYFVACSAVALFLFSRPGRWWFDDDDKTKSGGADRGGDVENVKVTDRLGGNVSAGATAAADAQPARGWFWSLRLV